MTESHHVSNLTVLVEHNRKYYRVVYRTCKCTTEGCQWHGKIVQGLVIDIHNLNAVVGNKQSQEIEDANQTVCCRNLCHQQGCVGFSKRQIVNYRNTEKERKLFRLL